MKYLTLAMLSLILAQPAHARSAQEMTTEEYEAYIRARNADPEFHKQLERRAQQYLEQSERAARGEKIPTAQEAYDQQAKQKVYQEQENPEDPRLDSEDFQGYLKDKADELDKERD